MSLGPISIFLQGFFLTFSASQPVIFTKRSTSIIASEEDIYPHAGFTQTLDYEGEVGVIIGKAGFRISEKDAMDYVWGYTIINGKLQNSKHLVNLERLLSMYQSSCQAFHQKLQNFTEILFCSCKCGSGGIYTKLLQM